MKCTVDGLANHALRRALGRGHQYAEIFGAGDQPIPVGREHPNASSEIPADAMKRYVYRVDSGPCGDTGRGSAQKGEIG